MQDLHKNGNLRIIKRIIVPSWAVLGYKCDIFVISRKCCDITLFAVTLNKHYLIKMRAPYY